MTGPTCALCRQPISADAARTRGVGGRCWRKLSPSQRAAIRRSPADVARLIQHPAPDTAGQLPIPAPASRTS